ncbi:MAG: hypothetical protein ACPGXK_06315 [Phycisphaerae bacterium]
MALILTIIAGVTPVSIITASSPRTELPDSQLQIRVVSHGQSEVLAEPGEVIPFQVLVQLTSTTDNDGLAGLVFDLHHNGHELKPLIAPPDNVMAPFIPPQGFSQGLLGFGGRPFSLGLQHVGGAQNTMGNNISFPNGAVVTTIAHQETLFAEGQVTAPTQNGVYEVAIRRPLATVLEPTQSSNQSTWMCREMKAIATVPLTIHINRYELMADLLDAPASASASRCLRLTPGNEYGCGETVEVELHLQPGETSATTAFTAEPGIWTTFCIKDEQHSLVEQVETNTATSPYNIVLPNLRMGDTDNNGGVDIVDLAYFIASYGMPSTPSLCPWDGARDTDFNLDGVTGAEDYAMLSQNWLVYSQCDCPTSAGLAMASSTPTDQHRQQHNAPAGDAGKTSLNANLLPSAVRTRADSNRDGVFDKHDVIVFETRHGLPQLISSKMP